MHLGLWAECIRTATFAASGLQALFLMFERPIAGSHEGRMTQAFTRLGLDAPRLELDGRSFLSQLALGETSWSAKLRARLAMMNSAGHQIESFLDTHQPAVCV